MIEDSFPALHARLSVLETQTKNINDSLLRLADDMHELVITSVRREQDAEALTRAFKRIESIEKSVMAQEIITATMQIEAYIHAMKQQRGTLLARIAAAATVADVQAVVWG